MDALFRGTGSCSAASGTGPKALRAALQSKTPVPVVPRTSVSQLQPQLHQNEDALFEAYHQTQSFEPTALPIFPHTSDAAMEGSWDQQPFAHDKVEQLESQSSHLLHPNQPPLSQSQSIGAHDSISGYSKEWNNTPPTFWSPLAHSGFPHVLHPVEFNHHSRLQSIQNASPVAPAGILMGEEERLLDEALEAFDHLQTKETEDRSREWIQDFLHQQENQELPAEPDQDLIQAHNTTTPSSNDAADESSAYDVAASASALLAGMSWPDREEDAELRQKLEDSQFISLMRQLASGELVIEQNKILAPRTKHECLTGSMPSSLLDESPS